MTRGLERFLFARRRLVVIAFLLVTLLTGWSATGLKIDAGFTKLVPVEHEYMKTFFAHRNEFGGADRIVIALVARDGTIFSPEFFTALQAVTDAVFFVPGVDRTQVYSIVTPNVRYVEVIEDGIAAGNVMPPDFVPDAAGFARVERNIQSAGLVGRLVANDFSGAIVSAKLQEFHPETGKRLDYLGVADKLEQIREDFDTDVDIHIIGFAKLVGDIADGAEAVMTFFGIALLITALFLYGYTGSWAFTLPPLACSLTAVIWQLGALPALGFGIDPMSMLVPFLVLAIGVSHGVQMVNAVQAEAIEGQGPVDAARAGFRGLLLPGAIALASDTAGFITIWFIEVPVIREIAITASLGVAAIILTNLGLLPVLLSYMKPGSHRLERMRVRNARLALIWNRIARVARRRPAATIIAATLIVLIGAERYARDIRIGDSSVGVPELHADSTYNRDSRTITRKFSIGVDVLTVIAETEADGCIDFDIMSALDEFEWRMRTVPGVISVSGLAGVARSLHAGWNEGSLKWRTLPRNTYSLVQVVSPVPTSSGLLNTDCSAMPVSVYAADHRAETIAEIVQAVKDFQSPEAARGRIDFRLAAGNLGVMAATNEEVAASQFLILGYLYAAIVVLCLVSFRSIAATICIVAPLATVSLLTYALMAILGIGLKTSTLPVVALGTGIGVDYGIYMFGRLRGHMERGMEFSEAYAETLKTTGTGVVVTALTLAAGVATWVVSPLKFQADMGTVLTFMFFVNMIGAVLLMPALGVWLIGRADRFAREDPSPAA